MTDTIVVTAGQWWVEGGAIIAGSAVAAIISSVVSSTSARRIARIQDQVAMAREERSYAHQDKTAADLRAANEQTRGMAELAAAHSAEVIKTVSQVAENVTKIELATNSMKDALVAATAKASGLEGEQRGRDNEIARVAAVKSSG